MIELKPCKRTMRQHYMPEGSKIIAIKKSLPFLESFRGYYTHRVKHVSMYTNSKGKSHFIVKVWCGASFCNGGSGKGETYFVSEPTGNRPICATCEGRIIGSGLVDDAMINGRKVKYGWANE